MRECPACSKEMIKGTVISSGSMPFGVNVSVLLRIMQQSLCNLQCEVIMPPSSCRTSMAGFLAAYFIKLPIGQNVEVEANCTSQ